MKNKLLEYILLTTICMMIIIFGDLLEIYANINNSFSLIFKAIVIVFLIGLIILKDNYLVENEEETPNLDENKITKYDILLILFIFLINNILNFAIINQSASFINILGGILNSLTSAVWEGLLFRYLGVEILGEDGELNKKNFIILILICGLSHGTGVLLKPNEFLLESIKIVFALSTGTLLLSHFLKTKNIFYTMFLHFIINYIPIFYSTFSSFSSYFGNVVYIILLILYLCINFFLGIYIIKKYKLIK